MTGTVSTTDNTAARRRFLRQGLALGMGAGAMAAAPLSVAATSSRRVHLINDHTWEKLDIVYYTHGMYIDESLAQINHLMRDHRVNREIRMDPQLLDQIEMLQRNIGAAEPIHILSGYRTPETNARLRKRSPGVAKYSLHMEGRAADIYIPGVDISAVRNAALDLKAGGVGYYSSSGFVHIDTGRVRTWGS
ncbi:MAG: Twin-arginine translocation pathway signal [Gammaproteobacteria bacterium]|nr:MAG: Twin-arginine translocation pathway signal [Gammaproteobacteria bacterium]PIE35222.1 MAG: Twin-arginine translocation pathway signal [Gammaproteobacteria bacterium]